MMKKTGDDHKALGRLLKSAHAGQSEDEVHGGASPTNEPMHMAMMGKLLQGTENQKRHNASHDPMYPNSQKNKGGKK